MKNKKGEIIIYKSTRGPDIEVKLKEETVWLTQAQISALFNTERSVITKHLNNIFKSGELSGKRNVQEMHIAKSDKPVRFYNKEKMVKIITNLLSP